MNTLPIFDTESKPSDHAISYRIEKRVRKNTRSTFEYEAFFMAVNLVPMREFFGKRTHPAGTINHEVSLGVFKTKKLANTAIEEKRKALS